MLSQKMYNGGKLSYKINVNGHGIKIMKQIQIKKSIINQKIEYNKTLEQMKNNQTIVNNDNLNDISHYSNCDNNNLNDISTINNQNLNRTEIIENSPNLKEKLNQINVLISSSQGRLEEYSKISDRIISNQIGNEPNEKYHSEYIKNLVNGTKFQMNYLDCAYQLGIVKSQNDIKDDYISLLEDSGEIELPEKKNLYIDKEISVDDICEKTYMDLVSIPYSMNFASPNLLISGMIERVSVSKSNPNNICYTLKDEKTGKSISIWAWNLYPKLYDASRHTSMKIVGNLNRNFMNPRTFTLDIVDMKFY